VLFYGNEKLSNNLKYKHYFDKYSDFSFILSTRGGYKIVVSFEFGERKECFEFKSTDKIISLKEQFEKRKGLLIVINKQIKKYFP
jgi:ribosomal protein L36